VTAPLEIVEHSGVEPTDAHRRRRAVAWLLLACIFWGGSFAWAKSLMAGINQRAGRAESDPLGVLMLLGWRFTLAGAAWLILFPAARRGWTRQSLGRAAALGTLFTAAMIIQQMGLTRTTEAVNAFLTSLSILFVPLILSLIFRKPPAPTLWIGVCLAMAGIWLMTGATPSGFGVGEMLGVACSILFSAYLLLLNAVVARDSPWRMTAGQFMVIGLLSILAALVIDPAARTGRAWLIPFSAPLRLDLALLICVATIMAFGLMIFYQPMIDPTRAAMIYLTEPVFAATFAFWFRARSLSSSAVAGAILILSANALVEWLDARKRLATAENPSASADSPVA
jgi:drug/metabolite transporter (DMT)-like permease